MGWVAETDDDTAERDQVAQEMFERHWILRQDAAISIFLHGLLYMAS